MISLPMHRDKRSAYVAGPAKACLVLAATGFNPGNKLSRTQRNSDQFAAPYAVDSGWGNRIVPAGPGGRSFRSIVPDAVAVDVSRKNFCRAAVSGGLREDEPMYPALELRFELPRPALRALAVSVGSRRGRGSIASARVPDA